MSSEVGRGEIGEATVAPGALAGTIQGCGALLVLDESSLVVEQASANLDEFLECGAEAALGRQLEALLPADSAAAVSRALERSLSDDDQTPSFRLITGDNRPPLFASLVRRDGAVLLSLEPWPLPQTGDDSGPAPPGEGLVLAAEAAFEQTLANATSLHEIARATVELVAEAARFDRTLIYAFLPDRGATVIAEIKRPGATAFLGLRFSAAGVPPAAPGPVMADSISQPVPLVPRLNPRTGRSPDLSGQALRAVAPSHLRYLHTMGLAAAINVALMVEGRLWGVLSCQHQHPRPADPPLRALLGRVTELAAAALARVTEEQRLEAERLASRQRAILEQAVLDSDNVVRPLLAADPGLLDLAGADGLAIVAGDGLACFGLTPAPALIRQLASLTAQQPERMLVCPSLAAVVPAAMRCQQTAAGMIAVALNQDPCVVIAAFRCEAVHEVSWGGTINPPAEPWRETVSGHCRPWEPATLVAWRGLPAWLAGLFGGYGATALRLVEDLSQLALPGRFDEPFLSALLNAGAGTLLIASGSAEAAAGGKVLASNRAFRHLFDLAPDQLIGSQLVATLHKVGLSGSEIAALAPGASVEAQVMNATLGERNIRISHRSLLHFSQAGGDHGCAVWLFEDITCSHRVAQALQSARDQAVVASRAKTEFMASMSHELRTPLNTIIGFSEIMRSELFGALGCAKYKEYVRNIQTSGEHLLAVISDTLDVTKVEAGHYVLEEQKINLAAVIEETCQRESAHAERAGVKLMQEVAARSIPLQADARALKQILYNLLSNAFKFTPAGGMVTCRALYASTGGVSLEVQDTGAGIPEDHLQRVLAPMAPVRDRQTHRQAGSGLGLGLVKVLTQLHGGQVVVDSQPGRGTAIRVDLPAWRSLR